MKRLLLLLFLSVLSCPGSGVAQEQLHKIVAVVNDEVITQNEINILLQPIYNEYKDFYTGEELAMKIDEARTDVLNRLVEDNLLLSEAKKLKVEVESQQVDAKIKEVKDRFASVDEFEKIIIQQNTSLAELRKVYEERLKISKLIDDQITRRLMVTPVEVAEYYQSHQDEFRQPEKVKVTNILIKPNEGETREEALNRAKTALTELNQGADFAEVAKKYSQGLNAENGGELGYVEKGQMIKDIDAVMFGLDVGKTSGIIESKIGFHIIKITDKTESTVMPLEEVSQDIMRLLHKKKFEQKYREYVDNLKQNAYISIK